MDWPLIISVIANVLLFLLLILFLVLYFTSYSTCPGKSCPVNPINPSNNQTLCTDPSCNFYTIKTIDGKYLISCFNCNYGLDSSVVASDSYNGDTITLIPVQNGYQMKMNVATNLSTNYFLTMAPENITKSVLKLTTNQNEKGTIFNIIPYTFNFQNNSNGSNIYQIGTPVSGTLLGESNETCLTPQGVPIVDGFNFFVNAPNGQSSKSLFLFLPAMNPSVNPIPINPIPTPSPAPSPSPSPSPAPPSPSPVNTLPQSSGSSRAKHNMANQKSAQSFVSFDIFN